MLKKVFKISLISSIILLIVGIFLIKEGNLFFESISKIIGIIFVVIGLFPIIDYFKNRTNSLLMGIGLISGIFSIVFGLLFLLNDNILQTIIPVFIGVWMIINGINKTQLSFELKEENEKSWLITFIYSFIVIIVGAYLIINPISGSEFLTDTIGFIICIYAVLDIIDCILIWIKYKKVNTKTIDKKKVVSEQ